MTDDMFPGHDRDHGRSPGEAFADGFADEPPLLDMVPRALAVYERGRRRRQVAGVGGTVAAVAATALVATQLLGGAGTRGPASVVVPAAGPTPTVRSSPDKPPQTPTSSPAQSPRPSGGPCDKTFTLNEQGTSALPIANQALASKLCQEGLTAMAEMIPGHTWAPIKDPYVPPGSPVTYLADAYAADADTGSPLLTDITTKPHFLANCANVWYPQTTCRALTLADGVTGIEFDQEAGDKPGGYQLYVDLPGGRQFQFSTGSESSAPRAVSLDGFLKLVKSERFAEYLKQYRATLGA